jgi:hypothetical protein
MTTAAVLLAAGEGARFTESGGESHKLLAPFMGWHVIGWSMLSAVSAKLDAVYVVVGAVDVPEIDGVTLVRHRGRIDLVDDVRVIRELPRASNQRLVLFAMTDSFFESFRLSESGALAASTFTGCWCG